MVMKSMEQETLTAEHSPSAANIKITESKEQGP